MRQTTRHRRRSTAFRPERLEDRTVLSTLFVTNPFDTGVPGDGSLRSQIAAASAGDTIAFKLNVDRIALTQGELQISQDLTISGPGACKLTISGHNASRVFDITGGTVIIAGLTIADGRADGKTPVSPGEGGGILNSGNLTLTNDILWNNRAVGDASVTAGFLGAGRGGGIFNSGTLTVSTCQFLNNQARGADGTLVPGLVAGFAGGGALANNVDASVEITGSLFAGNAVQGGSGGRGPFAGAGLGGAIVNSSTLIVSCSTFQDNLAIGGNDNLGDLAAGATNTGGGAGGAIGSGNPLGGVASVTVSGSLFVHNQAIGGNGNLVANLAPDNPFAYLLAPNTGSGGAIEILKGSGVIRGSTLIDNRAVGGQGSAGSDGGSGAGGGIVGFAFLGPVAISVSDCTAALNAAIGGPGGSGDNGGTGLGGGLASAGVPGAGGVYTATLTVNNTIVAYNKAMGGDGVVGGNGFGGGLYNGAYSSLVLTNAKVQFNSAIGGDGCHGNDGDGVGGGVYAGPLGTFTPDASTIKKNRASTSGNQVGP
ncbi:hypothetical protein OJF2_76520 [Aquisphaera giovannonii]|uniref:Uncharacterized protein n=1 Tax=Aquisphaera giovannonii TaxID=406548 RepID=A0A5B9WGS2_9BACT|nr:hypothetical protein [Aquisphaera giovannonii]QEH39040.1 hypothetical protein OJF2_76520 [Aquisphaera giovannonii]